MTASCSGGDDSSDDCPRPTALLLSPLSPLLPLPLSVVLPLLSPHVLPLVLPLVLLLVLSLRSGSGSMTASSSSRLVPLRSIHDERLGSAPTSRVKSDSCTVWQARIARAAASGQVDAKKGLSAESRGEMKH